MVVATKMLFGTSDIAARVGYSVSAIKKMEKSGAIPTAIRVAGRLAWDSDGVRVIDDLLAERRSRRLLAEIGSSAA